MVLIPEASVLDRLDLIEYLIPVIQDAGKLALEVYNTDFFIRKKFDASPVTDADQLVEEFVIPQLQQLLPGVVVVAEELAASGSIPEVGKQFWLVDPIDGTHEFVNHQDEFTVNVALVENGLPTLGVVLAPALGQLYAGVVGGGAFLLQDKERHVLTCRAPLEAGLAVVVSRLHGSEVLLDAFLKNRKVYKLISTGSSLKFCRLAAGDADVYPRFGRTMEWDTAAGHAILLAAGGRVVNESGAPLTYGKFGFENSHFIAWGLGK